MTTKFSSSEVAITYDNKDSFYQSFWDSEGSLHWAYFDDLDKAKPEDFLTGCRRWDKYMLSHSQITATSEVLDLGCGNGFTAIWLAQQTGCAVTGIDVSSVRVNNALTKAQQYPELKLQFHQADIEKMPLPDASFTHVWSQATLYHVQNNSQAWKEISRVLKKEGILIFDDLVAPDLNSGYQTHQNVYDYYFFEPGFTQENYPKFLEHFDFELIEYENLNQHLQKSYELLTQLVKSNHPDYENKYQKIRAAILDKALGWSFYCFRKTK